MRARGRSIGTALLLMAALTACGEQAAVTASDEASATPSAVPALSPEPTVSPVEGESDAAESDAAESDAAESDAAESGSTDAPEEEPSEAPTAAPADGTGPDLDGDGRADAVTLLEVPGTGWSFDVRLADGRETSAPLPDDAVVREDVEVVGAVDLDRDGADEVLVRTLRAVGGENAVVFRLDGDGVWLVRDHDGRPWELSTSGGMTGPRSYACADGEVLTRESERRPDGTYRAMTWRWTLDGHTAGPLGGARDDALSAEQVSLDPSTCGS